MSIALISGGMGDLGKATAKRLAKDGYSICVLVHRNSPTISKFLSSLSGNGHSYYVCDVSKKKKVDEVINKIIKGKNPIEIFVHSAVDPIIRKSVLDIKEEEFRGQFEAGFFGAFNLFSKVGNIMRETKKGVIIGITTTAIEPNSGSGNMAGYISSKFALRGLLRELAKQMAQYGVRVNAVSPSFVATKLNADLPPRILDFVKEKNPMKKIVTPEDVADVISFLCSDDAKSINGMSFPVSFGESINI